MTDQEAREKYGISSSGDMSGIVFPYCDPVTGQRRTARVRRDNPEIEAGKPRNKYISAYGDRRHLYFPPGSAELVGDPDAPIVLVEAEKSCLALRSWQLRVETKILPIAMGGCWGWRGRIGTVETSKGHRVEETGALPDLACAGAGRRVCVLLDSNVNSNPKVRHARVALVAQLKAQGADVWIAELPVVEGVNGPDDYIGRFGDQSMKAVLDGATHAAAPGVRSVAGSQADQLLRLAGEVEVFRTPDDQAYATVIVNGHRENWPIESRKFSSWLRRQYYSHFRSAPRSQAMTDALNTLVSRAAFDGPECPVYVRVAGLGDRIYLDLANKSWEVIEIDSSGWRQLAESPIKFRRAEGMLPLPLPTPTRGGDLDELKTFLNLAHDDDWRLIVSILLQWFRAHGPYPILVLNGEHGSAKSTTARVMRELMDPNSASHSGPPRDVRDVVIAASNQRIVSLDNLSHIPDWLSDALCRLATGGGMRTRKLYTDADETILDVQRPVILNGIEQLISRPDLMDRSVVISLPMMPTYRDEREFWSAFHDLRSRLLGAILDAVAGALARLPHVTLIRKPRMADFAVWGTAVERALGWDEGAFMIAYFQNRESANDAVLEAAPVASAIEKLVAARGPFVGTVTALLKELESHVEDRIKSQHGWPHSAIGLRNALKRLAPSLRMAGIAVQVGERDNSRRRNRLVRVSRLSSASSGASADQAGQQNMEHSLPDSLLRRDGKSSDLSGANPLTTNRLDGTDSADGSACLPDRLLSDSPDYIQEDV